MIENPIEQHATVEVEPIGTARQGYRFTVDAGTWTRRFDVRTASARRFLVVDLRSGAVAKRTSSESVARSTVSRMIAMGHAAYALDRQEIGRKVEPLTDQELGRLLRLNHDFLVRDLEPYEIAERRSLVRRMRFSGQSAG